MPGSVKTKKELLEEIKHLKQKLSKYESDKDTDWSIEVEESLRISEARLAEAHRIAHLGNWDWDVVNNKIFWSDEVYNIAGLEKSQYGNNIESFLNRIHPSDFDLVQNVINEAIKLGKNYSIDFRIVLPDGSIKFVHIEAEVKFENQTVSRIIGTIQDISRLKQTELELEEYKNHLELLVAERTKELKELNNKLEIEIYEKNILTESLKQNEERWQFALEGSDEGIWDWDIRLNKIYYSQNWHKILGIDKQELTGSIEDWFSYVHPDDINNLKEDISRHINGETNILISIHRIICRTGVQKWLLVRGKVMSWSPELKPIRMLGTATDFTERKRIEDALSWEMNINSSVASLLSLFISDKNVSIEEITNLVLQYALSLTGSKFGFVGYVDPNTGDFIIPTLSREIFPEYKTEDKYVVFKEYKGLWGWVLKNKSPLLTNDPDSDNRATGIPEGHIKIKRFISVPAIVGEELLGQISLANAEEDYTERELKLLTRLASFFAVVVQKKRSRDAHIESEKFLQATLDALPAHIAILDSSGVIISVNKSWGKFADCNGFTCSNYGIGMNYLDVCKISSGSFSEESQIVLQGIQSVINKERENFYLEYPCHSPDEKRWFLLKVNCFQGEGSLKLVVSHENITERKEAEEKIKSQNNFLRNILRSLTYPFFVTDARDYTIKMANRAAKEIYRGMTEGCSCFNEMNNNGLCGNNAQSCMIDIVKRTKNPVVREREIIDKDGNKKIFAVHGYPIINLREEVIQVIEYCIDITERRNAETKLLLQSTALEAADNSIVITDYDGKITWVNAAFPRLTGYSIDEVIGNTPQMLKSGKHDDGFYKDLWDTIKAGKVWRNEIQNKKKNGELYAEEMTVTPVRDINDNITHFIAIKLDITERKKAEEEVKIALEKEKELNELRSRFVSTISHEFRTPLTSVLTSTELLERYNDRWTNEKKIETLKRIQNSVEFLNGMISEVLTINKAESGRLEFNPQPLQLVEFCRHLLEEARLSANDKHTVHFSSNCENLELKLDEKLIRHIISNLLSNAIKYSPKGGKIEFTVNMENDVISITVKDEGIGISADDQNKLFEPFFRGKNISSIPGTGLGLSILKRAVDLHKGMIFYKSEPGKGTTFYVNIPLKY